MKERKWLWSTLAAAAFAVGALAGPAAAQDVGKCQKQLENIGRGFKDQIYKAIQFCKDTYRAEVVKAGGNQTLLTTNLEKKAPACGKKLEKVLGTPNGLGGPVQTTQAEKTYKKLKDLVDKGKCTNIHLYQLGHLIPGSSPANGWGDAWIRTFLAAQLKAAYEQEASIVGDLPAVFGALIDPDGSGAPTCAGTLEPSVNYCALLATPPCKSLVCNLDPMPSSLNVDLCAIPLPPGDPVGSVVQSYCQFPPWTGCDLAVVGHPSRVINQVNLVLARACTTNVRAMGVVKGPASCTLNYGPAAGPPVTSITTTSNVNGPENVTICQSTQSGGGSCSAGTHTIPATPSTACPACAAGGPGPIEVTLSGSMSPGDAVIAGQLQILTTTDPNCTQGTATDMNNVPLLFTTGNFNVTVQEADGGACGSCAGTKTLALTSAGNFSSVTPDSIAPGANYLDSGDLSGACISGGFPGACSTLSSLVTTFNLCCQ